MQRMDLANLGGSAGDPSCPSTAGIIELNNAAKINLHGLQPLQNGQLAGFGASPNSFSLTGSNAIGQHSGTSAIPAELQLLAQQRQQQQQQQFGAPQAIDLSNAQNVTGQDASASKRGGPEAATEAAIRHLTQSGPVDLTAGLESLLALPARGNGDRASIAYASRHQAAEQRRRTRINERLDALRKLVPHAERANTACFLEEVIKYVISLKDRNERLEAALAALRGSWYMHPGQQENAHDVSQSHHQPNVSHQPQQPSQPLPHIVDTAPDLVLNLGSQHDKRPSQNQAEQSHLPGGQAFQPMQTSAAHPTSSLATQLLLLQQLQSQPALAQGLFSGSAPISAEQLASLSSAQSKAMLMAFNEEAYGGGGDRSGLLPASLAALQQGHAFGLNQQGLESLASSPLAAWQSLSKQLSPQILQQLLPQGLFLGGPEQGVQLPPSAAPEGSGQGLKAEEQAQAQAQLGAAPSEADGAQEGGGRGQKSPTPPSKNGEDGGAALKRQKILVL